MIVNILNKQLCDIPDFNCYIDYQIGDGFKTLLPFLLKDSDLVITHKQMESRYRNTKAIFSTLFSFDKIVGQFDRIILDCRIPSKDSSIFKKLRSACKAKTVILVQPSHDRFSELQKLIDVSKSPSMTNAEFDQEFIINELAKLYESGKLK